MTSEVVVMNRDAVALAADSAMTLQNGKVLNTANKLYMLAPGYSIGILIYNNATLMGVSWELIIKLYRDHLTSSKTRFPHLVDYTLDFIKFVKAQANLLFPDEEQKVLVSQLIELLMSNQIVDYITDQSKQHIIEQGRAILGQELIDIAIRRIDRLCREWESQPDLFDESVTRELEVRLEAAYRPLFDQAYEEYLAALQLDNEVQRRIWQLFTNWFTKQQWFGLAFSGVVFTGYGDDDIFPCLVEFMCESYICGSLKYKQVKVSSAWEHTGIFSFAQNDIVQTLINGTHPSLWEHLSGLFTEQFEPVYRKIAQNTKSEDMASEVKESVRQEVTKLRKALERAMMEHYTMSTINMVSALPKDDLALMAETLVNITSFMRRVSLGTETVGGPTDVAVISKKDGFIWIKRKYYFDPRYNYHFFAGESGQSPRRIRDGNREEEG